MLIETLSNIISITLSESDGLLLGHYTIPDESVNIQTKANQILSWSKTRPKVIYNNGSARKILPFSNGVVFNYDELGVEIEITDPSEDNYEVTPAKKVELGLADFALCPTESIISYRTKSKPFDLIAAAAILQEDLSAIVVKKNSGIDTPKDLDGKIYSSYQARYEDGIVKAMVRNDGGLGNIRITYPNKLGIWNTLLDGKSDATWIFLNWEGIAAKYLGDQLKYFKMRDYDIPYSYSPVIAASESRIIQRIEEYKLFMNASKKGYLYSQENPESATEILSKYVPESDAKIDLMAAMEITSPHFGNKDTWGKMSEAVISKFMNWITEENLESNPVGISEIMTNRCLE